MRLALNVPRLGGAHGQAELQHVAFACEDVLAAAARCASAASPLLAIPGNYYDDLEARLDLPADLVAAMRELGVLYDRDAAAASCCTSSRHASASACSSSWSSAAADTTATAPRTRRSGWPRSGARGNGR